MGLLKRLLLALSSGGGVVFQFIKDLNIFSDYNLCVLPSEKLVAQPTSIYTLSITEIRLVAQPPSVAPSLCTIAGEMFTPTPTSVYVLSTAPT